MRARRKAAAASGNLLKLVPAMATTLDGEQVPVKTLKVGVSDYRVLSWSSHIPADGKVLSGRIHIDESMLTGESIHVVKTKRYRFAGTLNGDESFELEVMTSKADSVISNIVRLQDEAQLSKPRIAEIADVVARYFVRGYLNHFIRYLVLLASNTSRRRILDHAFSVSSDVPLCSVSCDADGDYMFNISHG
eukprot:TRINITY_DN4627_c0_g1_i1.p1 TRINITY_DN4627_c0_g1~~TRINITY_DN4627_c0_g1_i1.p1  ORF type:complete len:191 (+),score=6.61 TRINITY_DN4627_c0_g1_i1:621-1193(+)